MSVFINRELRVYEKIAAALAGVGLIVGGVASLPHDPQSFWNEYILGARGAGWMLFAVAGAWLGLIEAHLRSRFFDAEARIDAQAFGARLVLVGIGALVMLIRVFSGYPEGVMFAVLLMNALTPLINRWTIPRPFGGQ